MSRKIEISNNKKYTCFKALSMTEIASIDDISIVRCESASLSNIKHLIKLNTQYVLCYSICNEIDVIIDDELKLIEENEACTSLAIHTFREVLNPIDRDKLIRTITRWPESIEIVLINKFNRIIDAQSVELALSEINKLPVGPNLL